jgi:arylsulfatase A-like enzyme
MYPHQHGADWPSIALNKQVRTLPEEFSSRGYVTGAFSSNASWIVPEHLGKGFLRFDAYIPEDIVRRTTIGRGIGVFTDKVKLHPGGRGKKAPVVMREFLRFLDDYPGRPFFVYLCFMDVNRSLYARWFNAYFLREAPQSEVFEGYEAGLRELDGHIGRLWEQLQNRGLLENTIVVITSDHGQSFGTDVCQDHFPIGHGTSLYPEQTRIPLLVIYPPKVPAGRIMHETVSLRSTAATIIRLAEIADSPFRSRSWPLPTAVADDFPKAASQALMTLRYAPYNIDSVVSNGWQYIDDFSTQPNHELLFNLNTDLIAAHNLNDKSEVMVTMRNLLQRLMIDGEATSAASSTALPATHQSDTGSDRK